MPFQNDFRQNCAKTTQIGPCMWFSIVPWTHAVLDIEHDDRPIVVVPMINIWQTLFALAATSVHFWVHVWPGLTSSNLPWPQLTTFTIHTIFCWINAPGTEADNEPLTYSISTKFAAWIPKYPSFEPHKFHWDIVIDWVTGDENQKLEGTFIQVGVFIWQNMV